MPTPVEPPPNRRKPRRGLLAAAVFLSGGLLLGAAIACSQWHIQVSSTGLQHRPDTAPDYEVGIVFGAQAFQARPSAFLAARLDVALQLFQEGTIRRIIVSGSGTPQSNNEPQVMQDYLVARGVPVEVIVQDPGGLDTYDTCVRARAEYGVTSAILISQNYHLPRAITTCNAVGVAAIGVGDPTIADRYPLLHLKAQLRELVAGLKMEWDLFTARKPAI